VNHVEGDTHPEILFLGQGVKEVVTHPIELGQALLGVASLHGVMDYLHMGIPRQVEGL
jgi:hypothetical protein